MGYTFMNYKRFDEFCKDCIARCNNSIHCKDAWNTALMINRLEINRLEINRLKRHIKFLDKELDELQKVLDQTVNMERF